MSKNKPLLGYDLQYSHYLVGQIHCKQLMAIVYHFNGVPQNEELQSIIFFLMIYPP